MEQLEKEPEESNRLAAEMMYEEYGRKRQKSFWNGFILGLLSIGLVCGIAVLVAAQSGSIRFGLPKAEEKGALLSDDVETKLNALLAQINLNYYEDVDMEDLQNGLYKGLLEGIGDPYSVYYTPQEYENIMISTNANYYGIGAGLSQDKTTMAVTIMHIYDDSPAQEAGLQKGDSILKVNDMDASTVELTDLVTQIRGEEGSTVHLEIYREGESDLLELDVARGKVEIPTVAHQMLEDGIGYIQVSEFAENTATEFQTAVTDLQGQGMTKMIIDLRDNGGGLVTACQQMLDTLLPEGTVVYTEDKNGKREDYTSDAEHYLDMPIALLVNGNSASASEIFAGAIRDFDYGTLVGTTTFGKGIVQVVKQIPDGSAYKLTVAKYYTPSGDYIHGVGIDPDVEVEYEYSGDKEADYDYTQDNQVVKAIEVLNGETNGS